MEIIVGLVIFFLLVYLIIVLPIMWIVSLFRRRKPHPQTHAFAFRQQQEPKESPQLSKKILTKIPKSSPSALPAEYSNNNKMIGLLILEINQYNGGKSFEVKVGIKNLTEDIICIAIGGGYYVTKESLQIQSGDILNIGDHEKDILNEFNQLPTHKILPNLYVAKSVPFFNSYSSFNESDLLILSVYLDGKKYALAEKIGSIRENTIYTHEKF